MNTNNNNIQTRARDVSRAEFLSAAAKTQRKGGTIDDLIRRIDGDAWDTMTDDERTARRASVSVRLCQERKRLAGEFQAERTELERQLQACGAGTDDAANAIRESIRALNHAETTNIEALSFARRSRLGGSSAVSSRDLLAQAILDAAEEE